MVFHIYFIHQIKNLFIQNPKKPSSVENSPYIEMIVFSRLNHSGHKFAQEITVFLIGLTLGKIACLFPLKTKQIPFPILVHPFVFCLVYTHWHYLPESLYLLFVGSNSILVQEKFDLKKVLSLLFHIQARNESIVWLDTDFCCRKCPNPLHDCHCI